MTEAAPTGSQAKFPTGGALPKPKGSGQPTTTAGDVPTPKASAAAPLNNCVYTCVYPFNSPTNHRTCIGRSRSSAKRCTWIHDDDELNINPPTPCLGKRPQRPKPKGPGRPWGQKPLAHGRTVEGVLHMDPGDLTLHRALLQDHSRPRFPGADGRLPVRSRYGRVYD